MDCEALQELEKAVEKHAKSDAHIRYSVAEVLATKGQAGSILQQLQSVTEEQRIMN